MWPFVNRRLKITVGMESVKMPAMVSITPDPAAYLRNDLMLCENFDVMFRQKAVTTKVVMVMSFDINIIIVHPTG